MEPWLFYIAVGLLPVAAWSGYRLGRKQRKPSSKQSLGLNQRYFVGLNHLLNERPDRAIDTFIEMLEVDSETVETHIALGHLFRKRGEVDRAIRLHQNLIARPSLPPEWRKLALFELGLDYMSAGLFDRAESIFKELKPEPRHKADSLRQLMLIYQQTKDWDKAVAIAEQLQAVDHRDHAPEIAHFYCELAEQALRQQQFRQAQSSLKRALYFDSKCVRATFLRVQSALEQNQTRQAVKYCKELLKQDPAFVSDLLPLAEQAFSRARDAKGYANFLSSTLERTNCPAVLVAYAKLIEQQSGERESAELIAEHLRDKPSMAGLLRLIELHIEHAQPSARNSLEILYDIVNKSHQNNPTHQCHQCGFSAKSLYWQCPGCKSWGTIKPLGGLQSEQ